MHFTSPFKDELFAKQAILSGHFILSSGRRSANYVQCSKIFQDADFSSRICEYLGDLINKKYGKGFFDLVISPAMGGLLFGYEISRHLGVANIFVERVNGVFELRRSFEILQNANILIAEDVVTTGKSSMEVYDIVKKYNPKSVTEVCVIDRRDISVQLPFDLISLEKLSIPSYEVDNIPEELSKIPAIKPGSRPTPQ